MKYNLLFSDGEKQKIKVFEKKEDIDTWLKEHNNGWTKIKITKDFDDILTYFFTNIEILKDEENIIIRKAKLLNMLSLIYKDEEIIESQNSRGEKIEKIINDFLNKPVIIKIFNLEVFE